MPNPVLDRMWPDMNRATAIAHCLVSCGLISNLDDATGLVEEVYVSQRSEVSFEAWNREIDPLDAEALFSRSTRELRCDLPCLIAEVSKIRELSPL